MNRKIRLQIIPVVICFSILATVSTGMAAGGPFETVRARYPKLWSIWGSSGSDVFAAGDGDFILHYDGTRWNKLLKPARCVGEVDQSRCTIDYLWGTSGTDVFAVGYSDLMHYDGKAWSDMTLPPRFSAGGQHRVHLSEVWGTSGSDVYAVGSSSGGTPSFPVVVLHYDGSAWSEVVMPPLESAFYSKSVWGRSATDIFVTGRDTILHYDGTTWSESLSLPGVDFGKIRGSYGTEILVEGYDRISRTSFVMRHDGGSWSRLTMSALVNPWIVGTTGKDVYLADDRMTNGFRRLMRYSDTGLSEIAEAPAGVIWGMSVNDLFSTGETAIFHYDGTAWRGLETLSNQVGIWGDSAGDIFAVNHREGLVMHFDGLAWATMKSPRATGLTDVWGSSWNDVFAVGIKELILHFDGVSWSRMTPPAGSSLGRVWGASASDVFATGWTPAYRCLESGICFVSDGLILHYDGSDWSAMTLPPATYTSIDAVWGSSGSDVFALAAQDFTVQVILHYDGTSWSPMYTTDIGLAAIWGSSGNDVYAVGNAGTILHYDGTAWSELLYDITIPEFAGDTWAEEYDPLDTHLEIWGTSASDVYIRHGNRAILHFDGSSWSLVWSSPLGGTQIHGIWGSSANDVYAIGMHGEILHRGAPGPAWLNAGDGEAGDLVPLSWGSVGGAAGYQVHRSVKGIFDYIVIASVGAQVNAYDDPVGCASREYDYRVAAVYADGSLSAFSPADSGFAGACAPPAVTLVAPSGAIGTTTPTYSWKAQAGVDSYQLWVGTGISTTLSAWYTAAAAGCASGTGSCSVTPTTSLAQGTWYFNVKGKNAAGTGPWAAAQGFSCIPAAPPTALTLVSPSGAVGMQTPTYSWNAQPGVDSYQIWVGTGTSTVVSAWYTAAAAGCASGTGLCSVTPATSLAQGGWYFNVKGKNLAGTGPWAAAKGFSCLLVTAPTALTLVSPSGAADTPTPTYTWNAQSGADSYQLWVGTGATTAVSVWYLATDVGCGTGTGTCSATPPTSLAPGAWYFNVKGKNLAGIGPWASAMSFRFP